MRTFETANGGVPFYLDDIVFLSEGANSLLDALIGSFGDDFVLSGVGLSLGGSTWEWNNGFVVLGGEVCRVVAGTIAKPTTGLSDTQEKDQGAGIYWTKGETVDAASERTLLAGGSHSPWRIRTATMNASATTGAYTHGSTGWHPSGVFPASIAYANRVRIGVRDFLKDSVADTFVSSGSLLNGWTMNANQHLYLRKNWDGLVTITGTINGGSATGTTIYNVPVEYRQFINGDIAVGAKVASASEGSVTLQPGGNLVASVTGSVISFSMTFLGA